MVSLQQDIRRLWNGSTEDFWGILERAGSIRRTSTRNSAEWAVARLAEGLARIAAAADAAEWGHASYALQTVEAALDALRDAGASLPDSFIPSREEVLALRSSLLREWRLAQSEEGLDRLAGLSVADMRSP
ncbi:MAG: hypothetical protein GYA63_09255 [Armatimonadetes bacterium]|jgi:hypothetical protein|nr:hypothetical protein [Armatimonadota bacterium]HOC32377.1 hypothetical protein [Armatimonadota bacterium]